MRPGTRSILMIGLSLSQLAWEESVLIVVRPTFIMRNDPLDHAPIGTNKLLDHGNGVPRQRQIRMHTSHTAMSIRIERNVLLSSDNSAVVAAVATEIDPLLWTDAGEQIDVALQMSGSVYDIGATIAEEINGMLNGADRLPLMGRLLVLSACKILGLRVWSWWKLCTPI